MGIIMCEARSILHAGRCARKKYPPLLLRIRANSLAVMLVLQRTLNTPRMASSHALNLCDSAFRAGVVFSFLGNSTDEVVFLIVKLTKSLLHVLRTGCHVFLMHRRMTHSPVVLNMFASQARGERCVPTLQLQ